MAAPTPMGKANRMVMAIVHNEPRTAVRTPANSAFEDCGLTRNFGLNQERKTICASGYFSAASAKTCWRRKSEGNSGQLFSTRGRTTYLITRS